VARREIERSVQPSFLDRLVDLDPRASQDARVGLQESARRFKASLARDLEWLLNTRRVADPAPPEYEELARSLHHYGVPDFTSLSKDSPESRDILLTRVEDAVATFEPRLRDVRISVVERTTENQRRELHFLIEGTLLMDPTPEFASFDTLFQFSSGEYRVGER
jgi:type VI secretion system protein ImpF